MVQLISLVVLSRILSPAEYGVAAMAATVIILANVVGDLGLSMSALQAKDVTDQDRSNLFWLNLCTGVVLGVAIAVLAVPIASFYRQPELAGVLVVFAASMPLAGVSVQYRVEWTRRRKMARVVLVESIAVVSGLLLAVLGGVAGWGAFVFAVQAVWIAAVSCVGLAIGSGWRAGLFRYNGAVGSHGRYGATTLLVQVLNYAASNVDNIIVGRSLGALSLGLYSRAFQLVSMPLQQVASPLTRVLLPGLSAAARVGELEIRLTRLQFMLCWPILLALSILAASAPVLIPLVFGARWAGAVIPLEVLIVGAIFQVLGYCYYWGYLATGRVRALLVAELPGRLLVLAGAPLLVGHGLVVVSSVVALGSLVVWGGSTVALRRQTGVSQVPLALAGLQVVVCALAAAGVAVGVGVLAESIGLGALSQLLTRVVSWGVVASLWLKFVPGAWRSVRQARAEIGLL